MQLRMSPGGSTRYSRRRRPELPPSSVTVTTAARSAMGSGVRSFLRVATYSFSPRSTVESPVPPPSATIRTGTVRSSADFFTERFSPGEFHPQAAQKIVHEDLPRKVSRREIPGKFQSGGPDKFPDSEFPSGEFPDEVRNEHAQLSPPNRLAPGTTIP